MCTPLSPGYGAGDQQGFTSLQLSVNNAWSPYIAISAPGLLKTFSYLSQSFVNFAVALWCYLNMHAFSMLHAINLQFVFIYL